MQTSNISIGPFTIASPFFDDVVNVYAQVFGDEQDSSYYFISHYMAYPDFRGFAALQGEQVIGIGFGTRSFPGNWWHDRVAEQVGADNPALQNAWVLVELGILPQHQGRGIGTLLHNTLLASQPYPRALLSTEIANSGARKLYERLGWQYLHQGFVFKKGQAPYVVMHKELAELS